jgi:hypothetical protein
MNSEEARRLLNQLNDRIRDQGWNNVTQPERDAANLDAFYGAVANGGIESIFFNSPYLGNMADELLASLERVGAFRAASVFKNSFAFFPDGRVPNTLDARVEFMRRNDGHAFFKQQTDRFFKEAERKEAILIPFFSKHPGIFKE